MRSGIIFCFVLMQSWAMALTTYPLQIGLGSDSCRPNNEGLPVCVGSSPKYREISIPLELLPEGTAAYGFYSHRGQYLDIGYEALVKVYHIDDQKSDDYLTLKLTTWSLNSPHQKYEVITEVFANHPKNLNRVNLQGHAIGNEEFYTNVILGIRAAK